MTKSTDQMIPVEADAQTIPPSQAEQAEATASEGLETPQSGNVPTTIPAELENHPRYRIVQLLGRGGMGAVYKAEDLRMGRMVAIKVVQGSLLSDSLTAQRFEQEIRAAAKLTHPNIVTAYDVDEAGLLRFLVMEHVDGQNLADYLRQRGRLPIAEACDYGRQAAMGLQHAYERGMIHRDIKPHNLMRTRDGTIKILDFGLARHVLDQQHSVSDITQLTQQGVMMGTVDYMAPEQASDSRKADIRADIYSLGCTLYQLITGIVPFPSGGPIDKVVKHAVERPSALNEVRPDVPVALARAVQRMMAKEPDARFQTPAEVANVLSLFMEPDSDEPLVALPIVTPASSTVAAVTPVPRSKTTELSDAQRKAALRKIRSSASSLGICSTLYGILTFVVACIALFYFAGGFVSAGGRAPFNGSDFSIIGLFALMVLASCFMTLTVLLSYGAAQMRLGQGYVWCMAAVIAALVPITPLIIITGPIGLRALARLSEPDVKALFGRSG